MKKSGNKLLLFFRLLFLLLFAFLLLSTGKTVLAEGADIVQVKEIDYEKSRIIIDPNGNDKVYYSDSKKSTWLSVEGNRSKFICEGDGKETANECFALDISWVSVTKDYELNLKGDKNESVVNVILPARNSKIKAKFDKLSGTIVFSNEDGAKNFCWRKDNSFEWKTVSLAQNPSEEAAKQFLTEIEKMRVKGGKIYVKFPQVYGTDAASTGARQSKEVKVTISKRDKAPTIKIDGNKLIVNSKDTMEYMVIADSGENTMANAILGKGKWKPATKKMKIADFAPAALYSATNTTPKKVTVAFRVAETERKSYSKPYFLSIPAQASKPAGTYYAAENSTEATLTLNATKSRPMQYIVVASADVSSFDPTTAKWRSATSNKIIKVKAKKYPANSVIFVRDMYIKQTATTSFSLPSHYDKLVLTYGAAKK